MDTKNLAKGTAERLMEARRQALHADVRGQHRAELVAVVDGVSYINDSRATFLDAALATLASMERSVVWIVGAWSDDMAEGHVQELLRERVEAVVLFGAQSVDTDAAGLKCFPADDLRMAVFLARELASNGACVLFSPACPSGNGFANYEERGTAFKQAVRDL